MNQNLVTNMLPCFENAPVVGDPVMRPVTNGDLLRPKLEHFISSTYKNIFNATLKSFLPNLVAATSEDDKITAAFGYCDAAQGPLFLECYLERPIEDLLCESLGYAVKRQQIVEVGNLSIAKCANSVKALRDIASYLQSLGYDWIVCTATRYLRVLFLKSGSRPISIAQASSSNVVSDGTDWGNYYVTIPEILVGNISQSISLIEKKLTTGRKPSIHKPNLICLKD